MSSLICLSSASVSGVIMLIAIWLLQRGHVITVGGEEGEVGLFIGTPLMRRVLIKTPPVPPVSFNIPAEFWS
jgi:hypothetical protein